MRYRWPPAKLCSATLRVITIFRGASAPIPSRLVLCDTKWWRYWQNSNSENCHHTEWTITNNCSKRKKSINNTANTKGVTYGLKKEKKTDCNWGFWKFVTILHLRTNAPLRCCPLFCFDYYYLLPYLPNLLVYFPFFSDFNECSLNNAGCEHVCNNTGGSFNCDCRAGFKLKPDKRGCAGHKIYSLH